MKKFALLLLLAGCTEKPGYPPVAISGDLLGSDINHSLRELVFKGHEYLIYDSSALIHSASCPCHLTNTNTSTKLEK
jgi:hypothetical protein